MIAEAIDKVLGLARPTLTAVDGRTYSHLQLHQVAQPVIKGISVRTLKGLLDLYNANFEGIQSGTFSVAGPVDEDDAARPALFHVISHRKVALFSNYSGEAAERTVYAVAEIVEEEGFKFGDWYSQEGFIIALNAFFLGFGERDQVLKVVSKLATDDRLTVEDDGVSQTATAKAGISRLEQLEIKPRVILKPFRTFREVEQPPSEFLLRIKRGADGSAKIALFEADGGRWKLEAMSNIGEYLGTKLPDSVPVVA